MGGRLAGKVAIVTGAARGTGAAIARVFLREGARVTLTDVREEQGKALAAELGPSALFLAANVASAADWSTVVEATHRHFAAPAILVNNAALLDVAPIESLTEQAMTRLFRVNQLGPVLGIQSVLPSMKTLGYGSIVNIGSTDGVLGNDMGLVAYGATKFALRGITRIAAMELGRHAIRVNCIVPDSGNIEMSSPFLPAHADHVALMRQHVEQILRPPPWAVGFHRYAEIANMALFLASDDASGCTGGDFAVDGGYTAGRRVRP